MESRKNEQQGDGPNEKQSVDIPREVIEKVQKRDCDVRGSPEGSNAINCKITCEVSYEFRHRKVG